MNTRIFSYSTMMIVCFTVFFIEFSSAAKEASENDFEYTVNNGELTLKRYKGQGGEIVVPHTIGKLPVKGIGGYTFYCSPVTDVTIPNGVERIATHAFHICKQLKRVVIAASVVEINVGPFCDCTKLESIVVDTANPAYCSDEHGVLLSKDKTRLIACPAGKTGCYVIPTTVKELRPVSFLSCENLTDVIIPNSITVMGDAAFASCDKLTEVTIPSSVTQIRGVPFSSCKKLKSISVDAANPAFSSVDGVLFDKSRTCLINYPAGKEGRYVIPSGVTHVGDRSFNCCANLPDLTVPEGVTHIGERVFYMCSSLTNITLSSSVPCINAELLGHCYKFSTYTVSPDNPNLCSSNGVLFTKDKTCLLSCPSGKTGRFDIPAGVSRVGRGAFHGCIQLTGITIPDSVTTLDVGSFNYCTGLTSLTIPPNVSTIEIGAFQDCHNLKRIYFMGDAPTFNGRGFSLCSGATLYYRQGTKGWSEKFGGCPTALWDADAPTTATDQKSPSQAVVPVSASTSSSQTLSKGLQVGKLSGRVEQTEEPDLNRAPENFRNQIEKTKQEIAEKGDNCDQYFACQTNSNGSLTIYEYRGPGGDVVIPNVLGGRLITGICFMNTGGVDKDGNHWAKHMGAFAKCDRLTSVSIPATVSFIEENPFSDCDNLLFIKVSEANPNFVSSVDGTLYSKDMTGLVACPGGRTGSYVVPQGVRHIGSFAFAGCHSLTNIVIPDGVMSIGSSTFSGCQKISVMTFPNSVTNIGAWSFSSCGATNVVLSNNLLNLGNYVFASSHLTEIAIPSSVTSIGSGAFSCCFDLKSITLSANLTNIDSHAFSQCEKLTSIVIPERLATINCYAVPCSVLYFCGKPPRIVEDKGDGNLYGDERLKVYYCPGVEGWGEKFGGRQTQVWDKTVPINPVSSPSGPARLPSRRRIR